MSEQQQTLARMTKGSSNCRKQRIIVARVQEHVANRRKDCARQVSREIANSCVTVCVEDLDLRNPARSLNLGRSTNDNGFGMFRTFLQDKPEEQGRYFVRIDRWYPSGRTCNCCGGDNGALKLGEGTWVCPHCGRLTLRDANAALNIREEGLGTVRKALKISETEREPDRIFSLSDSTHRNNREEPGVGPHHCCIHVTCVWDHSMV